MDKATDKQNLSRRALLKEGGAALAGLTMLQVSVPVSAFGQPGEEVIPWLDQPDAPPPSDAGDNLQPWERLDSWFTPVERFFNVNHYGQPGPLDESAWRIDISGLVARPRSLTLNDIRTRERQEVDFTLECSGDNGFPWFISAIGNARWAGTPLAPLLEETGILSQASEVVFYGLDRGEVTIHDNLGILGAGKSGVLRTGPDGNPNLTITERFARSMSVAEALHPENLLCYEMNGAPLPPEHGFPVRLIAPGWFGVANVKWLTRIELRDQRYAGRLMARDYVTIREEQRDGQPFWTFFTVSHIRLKSAPARVARQSNGRYVIHGAAWGAPIAAAQVQIDGGPWLATRLERPASAAEVQTEDLPSAPDNLGNSRFHRRREHGFAWRFWSFDWGHPNAGEHTVRSRAIDVNGNIQPAPDDPFLLSKQTYWESNGQITRRIRIA